MLVVKIVLFMLFTFIAKEISYEASRDESSGQSEAFHAERGEASQAEFPW